MKHEKISGLVCVCVWKRNEWILWNVFSLLDSFTRNGERKKLLSFHVCTHTHTHSRTFTHTHTKTHTNSCSNILFPLRIYFSSIFCFVLLWNLNNLRNIQSMKTYKYLITEVEIGVFSRWMKIILICIQKLNMKCLYRSFLVNLT